MDTDNIIATLESQNLNGSKVVFRVFRASIGWYSALTYKDLNARVQHQAQVLMNLVDSGDRAVLLFLSLGWTLS